MSKRSRTRYKNSNPTTERHRRQKGNKWRMCPCGCSGCKNLSNYSLRAAERDEKLFQAQDELEKDYSFKNIEKVARLCPGITSAKVYQIIGNNPNVIKRSTLTPVLVVKGREGVWPGPETIDAVSISVACYLPLGVKVRVVGSLKSKSLKLAERTPPVGSSASQ
jgi:hypothetical protein